MKVISISGNIGVGKTTLIQELVRRFDWEPSFEIVDDNPFLKDFYRDPYRWAFTIQTFFLGQRLEQFNNLASKTNKDVIVLDRCVYEDIFIFSRVLYTQRKMSKREFEAYQQLASIVFNLYMKIHPIDHIFYLCNNNCDKIKSNICKRNRECETNIDWNYVSELQHLYNRWYLEYKGDKTLVDLNYRDLTVEHDADSVCNEIYKITKER
jgi:deoxyadenosine/deoxycytidine kinase